MHEERPYWRVTKPKKLKNWKANQMNIIKMTKFKSIKWDD